MIFCTLFGVWWYNFGMSFVSDFPVLVEQWHPSRNGGLTPGEVSAGSNRKVWWLCGEGHVWEARVFPRTSRGTGCPFCSGQRAWPGFNDLASRFPLLAAEWHPTKNGGVTPEEVTVGSRMRKFWWLGACGHEWESNVLNRVQGNGCYQCLGRGKPVPQGFLKDDGVLWAQVDVSRNDLEKVGRLRRFSLVEVWWLGECGHSWLASVSSRSLGHGCVFCASSKVLVGFNDLATTHPGIAAEWHPSKNGELTPEQVSAGSARKVWWLGKECGHEWESPVGYRPSGGGATGCPYCGNRSVLIGFNDLATTHPELVKEWHPTRNEVTVEELVAGSRSKVWWLCGKGHEWEATPENRTRAQSGCPNCAATTYVSRAERDIAEYVAGLDVGEVKTSVRNIIKGELDVYVPEKRIAVEFNGLYWHSENAGRGRFYHRDKWLACKGEGIQLIQIWEDDWNRNPELVKRMLAHKLGVSGGERIYARSTNVRVVPSAEVREFLEANHLQGYRAAKYWGLYTRDIENPVLVGVLGVQRKGGNGIEIIRFATSCVVVGGFTKLLKYVLGLEQYFEVVEVFSYSHNDHSDGGVYERNGFVLVHDGEPGYGYWRAGWVERQNRLKFSPSRVRGNRELEFVEGATERELAALNGLSRVWDSGSSLWVLRV